MRWGNANGRLTSVVDTSGTSRFHYDVLGRTAETNKTVDGSIYTTQTDYDLAGRVKTLIYPNQDRVDYTYDTGGNLLEVGGDVTYTGYNAAGQRGKATFANGVTTTYTYSHADNATCPKDNLRLCTIKTITPGGAGDGNYTISNVPFNWVNGGTSTGLGNLVTHVTLPLPFTFNFYGQNFNSVNVYNYG